MHRAIQTALKVPIRTPDSDALDALLKLYLWSRDNYCREPEYLAAMDKAEAVLKRAGLV